MWIPNFLVKFAAHELASEMKLEDNPMPETPWYKNRSTLSHIFTALVAAVASATDIVTHDFNHTLPGWIVKGAALALTFASALGIYDNHAS